MKSCKTEILFDDIFDNLKFGLVYHDLFIKSFGKTMPHECFFLNLFLNECKKNFKLIYPFMVFIQSYYPNFDWKYYAADWLTRISIECGQHIMTFENQYLHKIQVETYKLNKAMEFGEIVTDFLIRYKNYSLIRCGGQNIIITAQSNCHKRFERYLQEGYSLQRKSKIGYTGDLSRDEPFGYLYKLPVLPTKDIGYPIDEIMEDSKGNYVKVLNM